MAISSTRFGDSQKQQIRLLAEKLGFALCGFTAPDPPQEFDRYNRWVGGGFHGGMRYLASPRALAARADPRLLLPSVRSILVLGIPHARPPVSVAEGRMAAYALGSDYHEILPERLTALCCEIDAVVGIPHEHKVYTDTGPILERELGARAGLGWTGRNSMLIHPSAGSYFFLAEILTSAPFTPDPPFAADRCGTCERCLQACPTGCILPDRTIDARRCIACLTIEQRGMIPEDLRTRLGNWVFGCDLCQIACPWNGKPRMTVDPAFQPRPFLPPADLATELRLPAGELDARFTHSPLRRIGRTGYRRNLILALGNSGRPDTAAILAGDMENPDPVLREAAIWAVRRAEDLRIHA
jgi:epoxyqueuosine reductase